MSSDNYQLEEACKQVLNRNWSGQYTMPSEELYPHQWLWDSCFASIGLAHFNIDRAKQELLSLQRGQWSNGMLPNIIFLPDKKYKRQRKLWSSQINHDAPKDIGTTGVTQPPMLAEAVVAVGNNLPEAQRIEWYKQMFNTLVRYHQWLYTERDPYNEGLVLQVHPYEVGMDNTPPWVDHLKSTRLPWWMNLLSSMPFDKLVWHLRQDTKHIPHDQRIKNNTVYIYFEIMRQLKKRKYAISRILPDAKFLIQDLTFNCILIRANEHLRHISSQINQPLPDSLLGSMKESVIALDQLYDKQRDEYFSRDFPTYNTIPISTIAALMPLYSGAISEQHAKHLVEQKLLNSKTFNTSFPVPTVPVNSSWFSPQGYWRGPTWVNTNWLIIDGLRRYNFIKEARHLAHSTVQMVANYGPYEYFSPLDGRPFGVKNFSWSAALTIDLARSLQS